MKIKEVFSDSPYHTWHTWPAKFSKCIPSINGDMARLYILGTGNIAGTQVVHWCSDNGMVIYTSAEEAFIERYGDYEQADLSDEEHDQFIRMPKRSLISDETEKLSTIADWWNRMKSNRLWSSAWSGIPWEELPDDTKGEIIVFYEDARSHD